MKIELKKRPKNVTIIEGFPGFGLVATIATEFLIEELNAELIGNITVREVAPVVAVHDSKVINPIGIFYSKKAGLVILHALTNVRGLEWDLAEKVIELSKMLNAKEIISIEGIGTNAQEASGVYYLTNTKRKKASKDFNILKEGVVVGVTGALLLKNDIPFSCIFAESTTGLPDSRAAANVIKSLDAYLGLNIDFKPLLKKAEGFEKKIKGIITNNKNTVNMQDQKETNYLG